MSDQTVAEQWNAASDGWARWAARVGDYLVPATEKMLDLAAVAQGSRVLDVGCGSGEQTVIAAPNGRGNREERGGGRTPQCFDASRPADALSADQLTRQTHHRGLATAGHDARQGENANEEPDQPCQTGSRA